MQKADTGTRAEGGEEALSHKNLRHGRHSGFSDILALTGSL
jgi:hypothetical protein